MADPRGRTIACECGDVLTAEDDAALAHAIRRHGVLMHAGAVGLSDEQIQDRIRAEAQDAPSS